MSTDRVIALVASELGVPAERVRAESTSQDLDEWDSLAHLRICMALEDEFGVAVDLDDIGELDSVPAIVALVEGR